MLSKQTQREGNVQQQQGQVQELALTTTNIFIDFGGQWKSVFPFH